MFRVDDASRLIQFNSLVDRAADYGYDDRGQLLTADYADVSLTDETFSYDANGNRTLTGYVTDEHNRYTTDGTYDYEYDLEGNRTRRTEIATGDYVEYAWDHENRLVQVTERDPNDTALQIVDYVYDLQGRRIQKTVTDPATSQVLRDERYVYDGEHIALQFDEDGDLTNRYLHGPAIDQILADEQISTPGTAGDVLWPLTDHLGTVRDLAEHDDSTGVTSIANHLVYNSFGQIVSETNAAVDHIFSYTGRETDEETDLYFYRARYYDPAIGQFLSEDPIGFEAGDANTRRYVSNAPTTSTDPSGLEEVRRRLRKVSEEVRRGNKTGKLYQYEYSSAPFWSWMPWSWSRFPPPTTSSHTIHGPLIFDPDTISGIPDPDTMGTLGARANFSKVQDAADGVEQATKAVIYIAAVGLPGPEDAAFWAIAETRLGYKLLRGRLWKQGRELAGEAEEHAAKALRRLADEVNAPTGRMLSGKKIRDKLTDIFIEDGVNLRESEFLVMGMSDKLLGDASTAFKHSGKGDLFMAADMDLVKHFGQRSVAKAGGGQLDGVLLTVDKKTFDHLLATRKIIRKEIDDMPGKVEYIITADAAEILNSIGRWRRLGADFFRGN